MTTQIAVPCVRCGKPAAAHGEHHEPAKGMGGRGPKVAEHPRVPLCRGCHEDAHQGRFDIKLEGGLALTLEGGLLASQRALVVDDDETQPDPRYWSDEKLAAAYYACEANAWQAFMEQCKIAATFAARYRWALVGQDAELGWQQIAKLIGDYAGKAPPYYRRVREGAYIWEAFGHEEDEYFWLGKRVMITVSEDSDPKDALALAIIARQQGHTVEDTVEIVRARDERRAVEPPAWCLCPVCGRKHRKGT